jgi:type VI secretion system secreted protein VgrG
MSVASLFRLPITVKCTAPGVIFDFRSMSGTEELGRMFQYEIHLTSTAPEIKIDQILGQSLTVSLPIDLTRSRFFNGIIVRFSRAGRAGRSFLYRATICPHLWLLTRNRDCRVFQGATVPEVVQWVLGHGDVPMSDKPALGPHRKWEYLTQYRESDFDFISRIMQQEGIYYYFKHLDGSHEMVLTDSVSGHDVRPGYEAVPLFTPDWPMGSGRADFLADWNQTYQIQTSDVLLDDYDFRLHKGANISATQGVQPEHPLGPLLRYDHPGEYLLDEDKRDADVEATKNAGMEYARFQLEEQRVDLERYESSGNVRGLETGALFAVSNIPDLEGEEFLITMTQLALSNPDPESGGGGGGVECHLTLNAINKKTSFRPARTTTKPVVQGPQTARVVGEPGTSPDEQIVTDEYGRIKVHFFWDRHGPPPPQPRPAKDDKNKVLPSFLDHGNSCWVRVATSWAGSNWGSIHIPRIGQEVIVQFLEGDPDRPLVVGSLYNIDNMPPYKLPDQKTQSGIKSRSTPKGTASNFNEIRFEDKKGSEQLYFHAEKDQSIVVEASRSVSVGGDESITISGNRTTTVTKKDTVFVKDEHAMTVDKSVSQNFKNGHILNVYAFDQEIFVEAGKTEHVKKLYDLKTDVKFSLTQGDTNLTFEGNMVTLKAGNSISVNSPTEIKLSVGENFIVISPSGIEISANQVSVQAKDSGLILTPADATLSAKAVTIKATGVCAITGMPVNINS